MAVARRQFTVAEYQRMAESGILHEDDRVELIDGEVYQMSPIGSRHIACVNRFVAVVTSQVGQQVIDSVQNLIQLTDYSEPQPDLALLRPRADFYAEALPTAQDALLLIEVADRSLEYDRDVKIPHYAKANLPDAWLVNVKAGRATVYTQPGEHGYQIIQHFRAGDILRATTVAQLEVAVEDIF